MRNILSAACAFLLCAAAQADVVLMSKGETDSTVAVNRTVNPGFAGGANGWTGWKLGFTPEDGGGRDGSPGVRCAATSTEEQHGAGQLVMLNQERPRPVAAGGWSRAEGVDGTADNGYSVYVDVNYADGTHLWGQTAAFSTGTHDWERRCVQVVPDRPVASLTVHALFRGHNGTVWFDDFSLEEYPDDLGLFEGVPVRKAPAPETSENTLGISLSGGLSLAVDAETGALSSLALEGRVLGSGGLPVFVRDAAGDGEFVAPDWSVSPAGDGISLTGESAALRLRLEVTLRPRGDRLEVDGKEFFIDLLLFHRRLRCLVAIELKVGEFLPEFVGKMQFYLAALDRQVRQEDENPSIGIILCKEKSRTIVEYALHDARKPIGVATYEITKTLPKALKGQLPSPKDIAHLLEDL